MVIIVEGIDRVGKTTLCEMIEDRYSGLIGFDIRRFRDDTRYSHNYLNREVNTEKINTLQNLLDEGFVKDIILDRYHITEFVYGAIERSYKNKDMFDIDKRLAELDRQDTSEEEEDGIDVIDPGMMYDGHVHNDVVLIYVVPTDIKRSSAEHGYNLERHLKWYNDFYENTLIKKKVKVDYNTLDIALEFIDDVLNTDWEEEEPDKPDVPTEAVIMEFKIARILFDGVSKTFNIPVNDVVVNVYVNGLYMTEGIDYTVNRGVSSSSVTFENIYKESDICTLTYIVRKEG